MTDKNQWNPGGTFDTRDYIQTTPIKTSSGKTKLKTLPSDKEKKKAAATNTTNIAKNKSLSNPNRLPGVEIKPVATPGTYATPSNIWKGGFQVFGQNSSNAGYYFFTADGDTATPVAFIADSNHNPLGSTNPANPSKSHLLSYDEAVSTIIQKYSGNYSQLTKLFKKSGLLSGKALQQAQAYGDSYSPALFNAVRTAVFDATSANISIADKGGKSFLSLEDYLNTTKAYSNGKNSGAPTTTTRIQHQTFTPDMYELAVDQMFQQTLGRGASDQELQDFVGKLQAYDKKHPQKSVEVQHGNVITSTQSGGLDANQINARLQKEALAKPEAEAYNKATTYLNYFRDALKSPIQLG